VNARLVPVLVGLAVAAGLFAWRGGHYPLPVDLVAVGTIGLMASVGARELVLRAQARREDRQRAEETAAQLVESADTAISTARRTLMNRMPSLPLQDRLSDRERVDVAHVLAVALERFHLEVEPRTAAAVLRGRYELRTGAMDLDTDAYDYPTNPTTDQEK
jgi:hypothetical protein